MALLEGRSLVKYFDLTRGVFFRKVTGQVRAVDGVHFSLEEGETLAIVGESGCGKTTLSRLILRIETPTSGTLLFEGQDITAFQGDDLKRYRKEVQAVFQDPYSSLNPRMRIWQIVSEPTASNHGEKASPKERVAALLEAVGLPPGSMSLYPHQFSGGQRQRIAIARALAANPRLIVLDEPVSALDVSVRAQIMNLLKDLQSQFGLTFIVIAHDLGTVRYMATQVAVMYLGRIVESGSVDDVYGNPLHPYTRALLASAFASSVESEDLELVTEGEVPSALNPPSGCRFHPRCPFAMEKCSQKEPVLLPKEPQHWAACHLYEESRNRGPVGQ